MDHGDVAVQLEFVPVDDLSRQIVRFRVEVGFQQISDVETAMRDLANIFTGAKGNSRVDFSLSHD